MLIRELFAKPVDRNIEGVIKADDEASLGVEVQEYVLTEEVSRRLEAFLDAYTDYQGANGVWISGFFGSGKSHLLKVLALLLENRSVAGAPVLDAFLEKCHRNAILSAQLRKAASIPSRSILFNIDQKADVISKKQEDAVLGVFIKVFNEMCGYYGKQGFIAQFERNLDERGLYQAFKDRYQALAGKPWEIGREEYILEYPRIDRAYAEVAGVPQNAAERVLDHYRQDYKVAIEDFAEQVNAYIERQEAGFRLNFFVDEVGQYIADNVKLMTNLQTIAESLATRSRGRAWLVVTAQEEMDTVLGEFGKQQSNDFTKIQARFKTRLKLTSANVDEVIQKRLLWKNPTGAALMQHMYAEQRNNFGTLFDFTDGSFQYRGFRDVQHFAQCYPFIPYQFTLFQSAIQNLSRHNAFEGRHSSVGERSMLGVFQGVAIAIAGRPVGALATFDLMFEGIRTTLKSQIQRSILNAEQHLTDAFALRVLKALFLVKYVKEFQATARNIRVLLQGGFDEDLPALRERVEAALELLEQQTYIQRNGEVYEFLTDEEKDIEEEIKSTDVENADVLSALDDFFFNTLLRDRKIRYDATGQDFSFTRRVDEQVFGREYPLEIRLVTPLHEHFDNPALLQSHTLGKPILMLVLPPDERFVRDLYLYKKTEKYVKQNSSTVQPETVQRILSDRSFQNRERLRQLQQRLSALVSNASLFVAGDAIEVSSAEPKTRVITGFHTLIEKKYKNLRMLRGAKYQEEDIAKHLELLKQGSLLSAEETMTEPEQEMLAFIQGNHNNGVRTTLKSLVEQFSENSYGWYLAAIQCILAKLLGRGKVEARSDGNLLGEKALQQALTNTHGFGNVVLDPQIAFSAAQVRNLKAFFNDFFDRPAGQTEAKALGLETGQAFRDLSARINAWMASVGDYPFLKGLKEPQQRIQSLAQQSYAYYLQEIPAQKESLLTLKETILDPLQRFMGGQNRELYDEAAKFLQDPQANFSTLDPSLPRQLREQLNAPDCYRGDAMRTIKELLTTMRAAIAQALADEKTRANTTLEAREAALTDLPEFARLKPEQQEQLRRAFAEHRRNVNALTAIATVRDTVNRFETQEYPWMLTQMALWEQENTRPEGRTAEPAVQYVSRHLVTINFDRVYLSTEEDVEAYLQALKKAFLEQIRNNKRIQI